jgi:hypothetical protein
MLGQFSPERPFQQLFLELLEKPFFTANPPGCYIPHETSASLL